MDYSDDFSSTGFSTITNDAGHYSLWPGHLEIPAGWRPTGFRGTEAECVSHVDEICGKAPEERPARANGSR